jgi:hypothetical protein
MRLRHACAQSGHRKALGFIDEHEVEDAANVQVQPPLRPHPSRPWAAFEHFPLGADNYKRGVLGELGPPALCVVEAPPSPVRGRGGGGRDRGGRHCSSKWARPWRSGPRDGPRTKAAGGRSRGGGSGRPSPRAPTRAPGRPTGWQSRSPRQLTAQRLGPCAALSRK